MTRSADREARWTALLDRLTPHVEKVVTAPTAYDRVQALVAAGGESRSAYLDALEARLGDDWDAILVDFEDAIECGDADVSWATS